MTSAAAYNPGGLLDSVRRTVCCVAMNIPSTEPEAPTDGQDTPRWWPAPLIIAAGAALAATVQCSEFQLSGRPTVEMAAIVGVSEAVLFSWLMFLSRMPPIRRVQVLALAVAVNALGGLLVFADGFTGDGRPILTWRFAGAAVGKFEHLQGTQTGRSRIDAQHAVDLSQTGPGDYPQFRGPDRSGVLQDVRLSRGWTQSPPRLVWRRPIGIGWSSFAVVGKYCVTQEQRGDQEAVVCYDVMTGDSLWEHRDGGMFHEVMGGDGPRATPTIDDGRVVRAGGDGNIVLSRRRDGKADLDAPDSGRCELQKQPLWNGRFAACAAGSGRGLSGGQAKVARRV